VELRVELGRWGSPEPPERRIVHGDHPVFYDVFRNLTRDTDYYLRVLGPSGWGGTGDIRIRTRHDVRYTKTCIDGSSRRGTLKSYEKEGASIARDAALFTAARSLERVSRAGPPLRVARACANAHTAFTSVVVCRLPCSNRPVLLLDEFGMMEG